MTVTAYAAAPPAMTAPKTTPTRRPCNRRLTRASSTADRPVCRTLQERSHPDATLASMPPDCPDCEDVPLLADLPGRWRCPDCGRGWMRAHSGALAPDDES